MYLLRKTIFIGAFALAMNAALVLLPSSASFAQTSSATPIGTPSAPTDNTGGALVPIGVNDSLNITVVGESDLTGTYVVDPSGDVTLLFVGKVHVGGLTIDAAQALLEQKLDQIYNSVQVTVVRPTLGGILINVEGAVIKQGESQFRRDAHLNDVIQLCGPASNADLMHIKVTSGEDEQAHSTSVYDLTTFLDAGDDSGNPPMKDGDQVFVPLRAQESVSVNGQVTKPGRYSVQADETVVQLISDAGGLLPTADPATTYIKEMGTGTEIPFNYLSAAQNPGDDRLNPVLKDGDEVWVPLASSIETYAIMGAVGKPAVYELHGQTSLLDGIKSAGGWADRAQLKKTQVTRTTPKGAIEINVDASNTVKASQFYLQAGDYVYIPPGSAPSPYNAFSIIGVLGTIVGLGHL